jgi:hypothetical protein
MAMEAAKEQLGKQKQSQCLPKRKSMQTEDLGHQGVPKFPDDKADDSGGNEHD